MNTPSIVTEDFDRALQDMLLKFQRLARFDPDRAAQEAMATRQMMHEYLVMEGLQVE